MKKIYIVLLLLLCTQYSRAIEIVELPLAKSDKIVLKLMFRGGSMSDPAELKGISALTASLIAEGGTMQYTSSYIKEVTYPWAARWSVSVDKEVTIFTFEFHKDHLELFFPIIKGLITQPSMDKSDYTRLKSNQENYVNQIIRSSSDEEFSKMGLEDYLFRNTNYQSMTDGTTNGLAKITLEKVKEYYTNYYTKDKLTIGIAGNYDAKFLKMINDAFEKLPAKGMDIPAPGIAATPDGIQVEIIAKENALGSAVFMGFPLPLTRKSDEFAALMVANSFLGEHRKSYSKLYQKIRQERSMNYGDYSYIEWYNNGGQNMLPPPGCPRSSNYFSIWLRPVQTAEGLKKQYPELADIQVGHAHFAIRMALYELQKLTENGMTQADFELTKKFLKSYMKLYVQTPSRQLGYLMDSKFYGRKNYITEMGALLDKVTLEEVNAAMKKYWQSKNMFVTIVTDDSEAQPLMNSMLTNSKSPMSYSNALKATLPPEILREDETVSDYKLNVKNVRIVKSDDMFR